MRRRALERRQRDDSGYVFTRKDGTALNPSTLTRAFRWIVDHSELSRIRLHDLQHTHASIAVKAGVPIGVVSERLGHASPEFTLHRYSHGMRWRGRCGSMRLDSRQRSEGATSRLVVKLPQKLRDRLNSFLVGGKIQCF